jgi:hypothetical protein
MSMPTWKISFLELIKKCIFSIDMLIKSALDACGILQRESTGAVDRKLPVRTDTGQADRPDGIRNHKMSRSRRQHAPRDDKSQGAS